ncbi:Uncharacterised protein [Mycobacteroides abscessus subsp. abscessus]|nr:Uncharacterised protein [Mycobacteroides abscessus subsp. abscessus]
MILGSLTALTMASWAPCCTEPGPGSIRQFTLAVARCGNALLACPPSIFVGTQVVRNIAL